MNGGQGVEVSKTLFYYIINTKKFSNVTKMLYKNAN